MKTLDLNGRFSIDWYENDKKLQIWDNKIHKYRVLRNAKIKNDELLLQELVK